jgi:hypothetical protein
MTKFSVLIAECTPPCQGPSRCSNVVLFTDYLCSRVKLKSAFHCRKATVKRTVLCAPVLLGCAVAQKAWRGGAGLVDYVKFMVVLFVEGRHGLC